MKKTICVLLATLMLLGCMSVATVGATANKTVITLNDETYEYSVGSTITYTCYLKNSSTIENGQFTLNYPSSILEIQEDTIAFPIVTSGYMYNYSENLVDMLKFNFSNISGYSFNSDDAVLIRLSFTVIAAGEGTISLDKEVLSNIKDSNVLSSSTFTETLTEGNYTDPTISTATKKLYVKQTATLKVTGGTSDGEVTWATSKKSVATVSQKGVVTAKKKGTATITATKDGVKLTCKVTVKNPKLNKKSVTLKKKGKTFKLKVTGLVGKATFKSNKKKVATVNKKGKITAKKKGKATITVKANGVKLKCKVKVKK